MVLVCTGIGVAATAQQAGAAPVWGCAPEYAAASPTGTVSIVAHSNGGLVAKALM